MLARNEYEGSQNLFDFFLVLSTYLDMYGCIVCTYVHGAGGDRKWALDSTGNQTCVLCKEQSVLLTTDVSLSSSK